MNRLFIPMYGPTGARSVGAALGERVTGQEPTADLRARLARLTAIHTAAKSRVRARRSVEPDLEEAAPSAR